MADLIKVVVPTTATTALRLVGEGIDRPATKEDLAGVGFASQLERYGKFEKAYLALLGIEDTDDLSETGSMIRYLVECAIMYDDHEAFSQGEIDKLVAGHETAEYGERETNGIRALRVVLAKPMDERRYP